MINNVILLTHHWQWRLVNSHLIIAPPTYCTHTHNTHTHIHTCTHTYVHTHLHTHSTLIIFRTAVRWCLILLCVSLPCYLMSLPLITQTNWYQTHLNKLCFDNSVITAPCGTHAQTHTDKCLGGCSVLNGQMPILFSHVYMKEVWIDKQCCNLKPNCLALYQLRYKLLEWNY